VAVEAIPQPGSLTLAPSDRSLEIRSCHSLSRELEVLHDFLLGLLTTDATGDLRGDAPLQPSDAV
jgi:exodeoxyribonuclease V gamma subunit